MLNFKKRVWIVQQKERGELTDSEIASAQQTSRRHVQRLWIRYQDRGLDALQEQPRGRKVDAIPLAYQQEILKWRKKQYGIHKIRGILQREGIALSKEKITKVLMQHRLHVAAPEKGKRYHYIRWERKHSNSLWQTDYCWVEKLGCWLTGWLDDHSRLLMSAAYVTEATTENSIRLFERGVRRFGLPRETLSDRGCQYWSQHGDQTSSFFTSLAQRGVKHIYASVKKPTTCGKMERFWRTHNDERWAFRSLQHFVRHYNYVRPHMSLDYKTPYEVWKRDIGV